MSNFIERAMRSWVMTMQGEIGTEINKVSIVSRTNDYHLQVLQTSAPIASLVYPPAVVSRCTSKKEVTAYFNH
ncbi:UNVERIFIED_CONTAM: hypothetical protein Slati_1847600 [Sesamum latifolium]|uniref:Uncharacterized protein n=1 Tax=Sesamum latifolium TaxID=2727402 RepID=A0AAW2X374_9LAMI